MEFNAEQRIALTSDAQNLLVLAGAGTGKTRTIVGRAGYLLEQGLAAERLAIVTFTRRSAAEIRERLVKETGDAAKKVVAGTFHHFCLREMRARPRWFGFDKLTIMDRDDQLQLMKLVRSAVVDSDKHREKDAPASNELLTFYSYARNTNQPVREYLEKFTDHEGETLELIEQIFDAYKQRKQRNNYFDYDDILHRFAKVMHDQAEVRQEISSRYDHVLVDEMQDTNPLQWLILESLSSHAKLFCVGDDAQSIYAFRGADFRNVHSFEERLDEAETLKLELNYRSTQEILDLANWLLTQSKLEYGKNLRAHRGPGLQPLLRDFNTEFDEAEWIARGIVDRHRRGDAWKDHMILCRTGFAARPIEAQLIERKIPYRFIGGISLLQMAHVKDLLSAVRVVVNHRDELGWMRYLTLWPKIGEVTASRLIHQIREAADPPSAIEQLAKLQPGRKDVVFPLQRLLKHTDKPAKGIKAVATALEETLAAKYDRWESRVRDFTLLEKLAERHETLYSFLETYTLDPVSSSEISDEGGSQDKTDVVTLITVHSAKGTEAKTCYVASAGPGNYPHSRSLDSDDAIEEERRILYVALTRAKDELIITRSLSQGSYRASYNASVGTHYFLERLPSKLVKQESGFPKRFSYRDDGNDVIR